MLTIQWQRHFESSLLHVRHIKTSMLPSRPSFKHNRLPSYLVLARLLA
jgi:hypothetical protein